MRHQPFSLRDWDRQKWLPVVLGCLVCFGALIPLAPLRADDGNDARMLHVILALDDEDPDIGATVKKDGEHLVEMFRNEIPNTRQNLRVIRGSYLTWDRLVQRIQELEVQPNDSLYLHFSGHGADAKGQGLVLRMADKQLVLRTKLLDELKRKGARLTVLMSDACATEIDAEPSRMMAAHANAEDLDHDACRYLFFRHRGVVDLHAATPPEQAACTNNTGGLFTNAVVETLTQPNFSFQKRPIITWTESAEHIVNGTRIMFEGLYKSNANFRTVFGTQSGQNVKAFSVATPVGGGLPKMNLRTGFLPQDTDGTGVRIIQVYKDSQAEFAQFRVNDILHYVEGAPGEGRQIRSISDVTRTFWSDQALPDGAYSFHFRDQSGKAYQIRTRIRHRSVRR